MFNLLASPMVKLGSLSIALIDVIAFAFLLIAVFIGIKKGFAKQLLSLLGLVASIVVAVLLCTTVANFIAEKMPGLYSSIESFVADTLNIPTNAMETREALEEALRASSVPAFLHEALINSVINSEIEVKLLEKVTGWFLTVISFLFLLIVSRILFAIIKKIIYKFVELPGIRAIDKLLGAVFSIIKCTLLITVVLLILSIFMGSGLNDMLVPDGNPSLINKYLEFVMNLPFMSNLFGKILA